MIYLNTMEEGGETTFPALGFGVSPRAGLLLMWNNMRPDGSPNPATLHEATPVDSGRKYVVTKWFRENPWRARRMASGRLPLPLPPLAAGREVNGKAGSGGRVWDDGCVRWVEV